MSRAVARKPTSTYAFMQGFKELTHNRPPVLHILSGHIALVEVVGDFGDHRAQQSWSHQGNDDAVNGLVQGIGSDVSISDGRHGSQAPVEGGC